MIQRRSSLTKTADESTARWAGGRGDVLLAIGNGRLLSHRLDTADVVIGRDTSCDLAIDHRSLSRRHAVVRLGSRATVQDLGSTNGTRVGGQTLRGGEPVELDDTGFQIGPYSFLIAVRQAAASRSAPGHEMLRVDDPTRDGASALVRRFAANDVNILITGETGVGKEVLAATLHELSGRSGPFIRINCAALNESLLESELFGHERGAFTGAADRKRGLIEAAEGGTVMLDEIGEIAVPTQAKLLRVIERREVMRIGSTQPIAVDVRFIAATNRDLATEIARGAFREDLFYRLDGVTLTIPPLRERHGAIVPLAIQFLEAARSGPGSGARLSVDAVAALNAHAWPGNVRELKAVIERAAVLAGTSEITIRHLTLARPASRVIPSSPAGPLASAGAVDPVHDLDPDQLADRERIVRALSEAAGNQTRAAKRLGISRTTLITKLRIYKIPRPSSGARR